MSFSLVARIWEYRFQPNERAVLQALADHADVSGGSVRPSVARIAWKTDYSERQVQRVMKALVQRGVLLVVHPASGRRPTEYRIDLDAAERKPAFATERGDIAVSPRQDVTSDKMSPLRDRRDDKMSPLAGSRGDICDTVGVTFATERGDIAVSPEPTREQTTGNRETPPTPSPGVDDAKPSVKQRGVRIPDDFAMTPEMYAYAASKGVTADEADGVTEEFILFWQSASGRYATKSDWKKAWMLRILDQIQMGKIGPSRRQTPGKNGYRSQADINQQTYHPDGRPRFVP